MVPLFQVEVLCCIQLRSGQEMCSKVPSNINVVPDPPISVSTMGTRKPLAATSATAVVSVVPDVSAINSSGGRILKRFVAIGMSLVGLLLPVVR